MHRAARYLPALLLLFATCAHTGPSFREELDAKGILFADVGDGQLLCVVNSIRGEGQKWFLVSSIFENRELGACFSELPEVHGLEASPCGRFLAVYEVGEGHPVIEIVDLQLLCDEGRYVPLLMANPYPGTVGPVRWEDDRYIVASDVLLSLRDDEGNLVAGWLPLDVELFALCPQTKTVDIVAPEKSELAKQLVAYLSSPESWERRCAAQGLRLHGDRDALPRLRSALSLEQDPSVAEELQHTIQVLGSHPPTPAYP